MANPIKVLIVDDSAVVRQVSAEVLSKVPGMQVTAVADPLFALERMKLQQHRFRLKARHMAGAGHRNVVFEVWSGDVWLKHVGPAPGK